MAFFARSGGAGTEVVCQGRSRRGVTPGLDAAARRRRPSGRRPGDLGHVGA